MSTSREALPLDTIVVLARGSIYLARELYDAHLAGIESVALLRREESVLIVPLQRDSGGGLLLKIRNARGDRVIHAQEFLRDNGYLEDFAPRNVRAYWDPQSAALVLPQMPRETLRG